MEALAKPGDIVAVELPTHHGILQDAIEKYLESGQYDKHIRKMRRALQSQMRKYLGAISASFPDETKLSVPPGGLSIWVELPAGTDAYALQKAALEKGIGICPGHIFSVSDFFNHYIRVNYCPLRNAKVKNAIKLLANLVLKI